MKIYAYSSTSIKLWRQFQLKYETKLGINIYYISYADYDPHTGTICELKINVDIPVKGEVHHKYDEITQGIEVGNRCQIEIYS